MRMKRSFGFNDVMLVPRLSHLKTRADADLTTTVATVKLGIPIIAANMSSVCETDMAVALGRLGGLGIIHRMCTVNDQAEMVRDVMNTLPERDSDSTPLPVGFSIGVSDDWRDRMDACRDMADIVCLDVAHGHHDRVIAMLEKYFGIYKNFPIIIGQVATTSAVRDLLKHVRNPETVAFKTSIGGGSLCTTRIKTGFGVPTLQAIMDIHDEFSEICIIGDGGIKESGDIVKSLAAGASAVMLGNLLAGTDEAPGKIIKAQDQLFKVYRGSASFGDKALRGEDVRNIEGEETLVAYKGSVTRVINSLLDGLRSGFSYGGAKTIVELQDSIEFQEISVHGYRESLAHGA